MTPLFVLATECLIAVPLSVPVLLVPYLLPAANVPVTVAKGRALPAATAELVVLGTGPVGPATP